jgi:putative PIN family toxin of toxin-antitoxin system
MIVVDTNVVLDLLVFDDPASAPLREVLRLKQVTWVATRAMRDELARVLNYPQIVPRLAYYQRSAEHVLSQFEALVRFLPAPPKAPVRCTDEDDQAFIDLAVAHRATLLSKDRAVLACTKRLAALGVTVRTAWPALS